MMELTYYGHSCFLLDTGSTKILFDPFITPNELSKQILSGYIKNDSAVLVDLDAEKNIYFKNVESVNVD